MAAAISHQMTVVNRLLRLTAASYAAWILGHDDVIVLHGSQRPGLWVSVLRPMLTLPLVFLQHSNFYLQFAHAVPVQLCTLAACLVVMRTTTCVVVGQPGSTALSQQLCKYMKLCMHYLLLLGQEPPQAVQAAEQECHGLDGLVLLALYAHVLILVLLPCLVVYFVELDLKLGFIKQQKLSLCHAPPCLKSGLCKAVVVYGAVVGAWVMCEVALLLLGPLECSSSGLLVTAGRQTVVQP